MVEVFPCLGSTNDLAKEKALAGAPAGTVIIADEQTKGRGRKNRTFFSPPAAGVYLSVILRPRLRGENAIWLTTAAAAATAQAIESLADCRVEIKWVNDLYLAGKKIAGISTEAVADWESGGIGFGMGFVVIGVGVNVKSGKDGFPAELADKAGAIGDLVAAPVSRDRLAAAMINRLLALTRELEADPAGRGASLIAEARQRSCVLGRRILIEGDDRLTAGTAMDLDELGFLVVEDEAGERRVLRSAEVSLRLR